MVTPEMSSWRQIRQLSSWISLTFFAEAPAGLHTALDWWRIFHLSALATSAVTQRDLIILNIAIQQCTSSSSPILNSTASPPNN